MEINKMPVSGSKITIHMVSSLDGFIGKPDGDISWMETRDYYENGTVLSDEEISEFLRSIDCYVMGSKTYEHARKLGWPYGDTPVFVLSSRKLTAERNTVQFYSGNPVDLVEKILRPNYKNIWLVGGSEATKEFIRLNLVDKIVVSVMPVILGEGILFFNFIGKEVALHLENVKAYRDGMVELSYEIEDEIQKPSKKI